MRLSREQPSIAENAHLRVLDGQLRLQCRDGLLAVLQELSRLRKLPALLRQQRPGALVGLLRALQLHHSPADRSPGVQRGLAGSVREVVTLVGSPHQQLQEKVNARQARPQQKLWLHEHSAGSCHGSRVMNAVQPDVAHRPQVWWEPMKQGESADADRSAAARSAFAASRRRCSSPRSRCSASARCSASTAACAAASRASSAEAAPSAHAWMKEWAQPSAHEHVKSCDA